MTWLGWTALIAASLALAAVALTVLGARRWRAATCALTTRLEAGRQPPLCTHYDPQQLEGLPAPVQRYFRSALTPGQAIVTAATIEHSGSFNLSATAEQWKPFTSHQRVLTRRPGFLWNARIVLAPGLAVRVHDTYLGGEGLLHAAVLGLVSMARLQGGGELAGR